MGRQIMMLLWLLLSQAATTTTAYRVTPPPGIRIRAQGIWLFGWRCADTGAKGTNLYSQNCNRFYHHGHHHSLSSNTFSGDVDSSSNSSSTSDPTPQNATTFITRTDSLALANQAMKYWAKSKSWRRLSPLVELALVSHSSTTRAAIKTTDSIADVGTDHGLLAVALAATGQFARVTGVDLSELALRQGAYQLLNDICVYQQGQNQTSPLNASITPQSPLPVTFRHGNGLQALLPGEADTVCIAGMGVHTMLEILLATTSNISSHDAAATADGSLAPCQRPLLLDELACQRLILQPTNARPHLLTLLYHQLQFMNWSICDERVEYLSSRWYLSVALERSANCTNVVTSRNFALPGTILAQSTDSRTRRELYTWVSHHATWIRQDAARTGVMRLEDGQWLAAFDSTETKSATIAM
jgi:tRNA A22 N-methylase